MSQAIKEYITKIKEIHKTKTATEHSYRSALENLLESINPNITAQNESQRITGVGMPDFTIMDKKNKEIKIGQIEAKDLYVSLNEKKNKDQLDRYLRAFDNFIYTNNLTFNFYRNGQLKESVSLWTATKKGININDADLFDDNVAKLETLLKDFLNYKGQTIKYPKELAKVMAGKAQLINIAIKTILNNDQDESTLRSELAAFQEILIKDLDVNQFADMYAQTVVYGLLTARLHDPTLPTFSREEAERLIPNSTPFLKWMFLQMKNDQEFDDRIAHILDDMIEVFRHCDVKKILDNYGKATDMNDPVIHFYETFLAEYDPETRKKRGVYYTPDAMVNFIVRGIDSILQTEFGLPEGLADTSQVEATFEGQGQKIKKKVHKVQVLDPATGTGTFLNETIKYIYNTYFKGQEGRRSGYVENHLLPRIWGFELLMASYTMAHLKLGLTLTETGYKDRWKRVGVYLTNSLEEPSNHIQTLFAHQLAKEANEANKIKNEQPIMIVMGNPPYSWISGNNGDFIMNLIEEYKYVNGQHFGERKHWLGDDYVKFIRYAESFVEKNGEWIVGFVNNHGFLDNPTFRWMRRHLMKTFDKIFVLDLHGNAKKKEIAPDGSKDENVFDIQQGVSINLFVKTGQKSWNALAEVYHADLRGKRQAKYDRLAEANLADFDRTKVETNKPYYFLVPKDWEGEKKYQKWAKVNELSPHHSVGCVTWKDRITIWFTTQEVQENMLFMRDESEAEIRNYFGLKAKDGQDWTVPTAKKDVQDNFSPERIIDIAYRPFDIRKTFYTGKSKGIYARPGYGVMKHFLCGDSFGLICKKGHPIQESAPVFASDKVHDFRSWSRAWMKWWDYQFPLYLYDTDLEGKTVRTPNLNMEILKPVLDKLGLDRTPDGPWNGKTTAGPEDIFDYIYAVLHSPNYREKYKEFLKIDFPRIPRPTKINKFWPLVSLGRELRQIHLLEHPTINSLITTYPEDGNNKVEKITNQSYRGGKVYINETQYFGSVPPEAREFYIGGYQPAQKRLKDRNNRTLSDSDILHYQKIIVALSETGRIIQEIDKTTPNMA